MSEAVIGMLKFCFDELHVESVFAQCSKKNMGSKRVMEKAGMSFLQEFVSPRRWMVRR